MKPKADIAEYKRRHWLKNRDRYRAAKKARYALNREANKARSLAYYSAHRETRKAKMREYQLKHRDRLRNYHRKKYRAHRDAHLTRVRNYKLSNPDKVKTQSAASYQRHRKTRDANNRAWALAHPERRRGHRNAWIAKHPDLARACAAAKEARRRARKRGVTADEARAIAKFYEIAAKSHRIGCYWCGRRTSRKRRHVDHIIALADNGPHVIENLCIACPKCNSAKNAKRPEDFSGQFVLQFAKRVQRP